MMVNGGTFSTTTVSTLTAPSYKCWFMKFIVVREILNQLMTNLMKNTCRSHRLNYGNKCLAKFYFKSNGRIEIFKKKIHGKEVSHDRVKPLLRLFGQGGGGGL